MGKEVTVVCPDSIPEMYKFVDGVNRIVTTDLGSFDFSKFDVWFAVDTEQWNHVGIEKNEAPIDKVLNVDHHPGSNINPEVGILDLQASSTCEILYLMFEDWKIKIDKELATILLAGIIQDTNSFQQKNTGSRTHFVAARLMELGADSNYVIFKTKRSNEVDQIKLWGEFGTRLQIDTENQFVWSAISHEEFNKYNVTVSATSEYANTIGRTIEGTNFCIIMAEKKKGVLSMSIRARVPGFDVSLIARELGGGGHRDACGALVVGLPFSDAVEKTLKVARKFAKLKFTPEIPLT